MEVALGGVDGMMLARKMGNRFDSLPFSAIYGRDGKPALVRAGALTREELEKAIPMLLKES